MSSQRHRDNKKSQAKEDHPKRNFYQNGMRYPDRWTKYGTIGRVMSGSKFIAFKTPLSDEFFIGKPETPFGLKDVVETVTAAGKKLGLVVDLTNTQRYYKAADWADFGVEYKKIFCPGHTIHTNTELIKEFVAFVSEFLSKNDNADLVIGVHCTHGLNRTGFLICQYLITKENWTAEDAVKAFEEARGHEIERWEYKATLLGWDPANKPEVAISPEPTKNEDSRKREKDESGTCESKRAGRSQKYFPDEHWRKKKEWERPAFSRQWPKPQNPYGHPRPSTYFYGAPRQSFYPHRYSEPTAYPRGQGWREWKELGQGLNEYNQPGNMNGFYQRNPSSHRRKFNDSNRNPTYRNDRLDHTTSE